MDSTNPIGRLNFDRILLPNVTFHKHVRHFQRKLPRPPPHYYSWHDIHRNPMISSSWLSHSPDCTWVAVAPRARVKVPKPSYGLWGGLIRKALNRSSKLGKPQFARTRRRKGKKPQKYGLFKLTDYNWRRSGSRLDLRMGFQQVQIKNDVCGKVTHGKKCLLASHWVCSSTGSNEEDRLLTIPEQLY